MFNFLLGCFSFTLLICESYLCIPDIAAACYIHCKWIFLLQVSTQLWFLSCPPWDSLCVIRLIGYVVLMLQSVLITLYLHTCEQFTITQLLVSEGRFYVL